MRNPLLKAPLLLNIVVLILSGIISAFSLIFGFAHVFEGIKQFIEGNGPDIPTEQTLLGWTIVIFLCVLGIGTLYITIASIRAIYHRFVK